MCINSMLSSEGDWMMRYLQTTKDVPIREALFERLRLYAPYPNIVRGMRMTATYRLHIHSLTQTHARTHRRMTIHRYSRWNCARCFVSMRVASCVKSICSPRLLCCWSRFCMPWQRTPLAGRGMASASGLEWSSDTELGVCAVRRLCA